MRAWPPRHVPQDMSYKPALLAALLACTPPAEPPGPAAKAAARELWTTRCANCHGPDGRGDGPSGRVLLKPPRDFHDATWQAGVTDDHLRRTIVEGGHSVGLSRDMAANADLAHRPAVVDELVQIVRSHRRGPPAPSSAPR